MAGARSFVIRVSETEHTVVCWSDRVSSRVFLLDTPVM